MIGVFIGCGIITWVTKTRFARKLRETGHVVPEERLLPMIAGGVLLPAGLFWWAWTSNPHINPWSQIVATVFIGMGVFLIFLQGLKYVLASSLARD